MLHASVERLLSSALVFFEMRFGLIHVCTIYNSLQQVLVVAS